MQIAFRFCNKIPLYSSLFSNVNHSYFIFNTGLFSYLFYIHCCFIFILFRYNFIFIPLFLFQFYINSGLISAFYFHLLALNSPQWLNDEVSPSRAQFRSHGPDPVCSLHKDWTWKVSRFSCALEIIGRRIVVCLGKVSLCKLLRK